MQNNPKFSPIQVRSLSSQIRSSLTSIKYQSLIVLIGLCFSSLANAQLLIVSTGNFNSASAWSIDIDGDGVDELAASTTASQVIRTADQLVNNSTWPNSVPNGTGTGGAPSSPLSNFDGLFTAASSNALTTDNKATDGQWLNSATIWHGTYTSDLSNAVSVVGWLIEDPTTGSNLGTYSSINHNDDYYIYYHNFGLVATNASLTINYSTDILNTSAVPEPSTYAAIFGGIALLGVMIKRRRRVSLFHNRLLQT